MVSSVSLSKQDNALAELAICVRGNAYMLAKQTAATEVLEKPIVIITSLPLIPWKHFNRYRQEPMIMVSWYRMKTQIVIPRGRFDPEPHEFFLYIFTDFIILNLFCLKFEQCAEFRIDCKTARIFIKVKSACAQAVKGKVLCAERRVLGPRASRENIAPCKTDF